MSPEDFKKLIQGIVLQAQTLRAKYVPDFSGPVNYACIFSQSQEEYDNFLKLAQSLGQVVKETKSGPLFQLGPLETAAGELKLLKVRIPDPTRPEKGDADFTLDNYQEFKDKYLNQPGFKLIEREEMEMIELIDAGFNVRCYFSHPTLLELLEIE